MPQFARSAARLRNRRNSVLENELFLRAGLEQQREFIKALDASQQFRAVHEVNCHSGFLSAGEVQKTILDVLWYCL